MATPRTVRRGPGQLADLWQARLAVKTLRRDQREAIAEAVKWFRKAAEQGYGGAQFNLGVMYDNGYGVPQDYVQAYMWFNLAAVGFPPGENRDSAAENRDIVAKFMTPAQIAEAQRLAREWRPRGQ